MPGSRSEMNPKREIFFNKYSNIADAFNRLRVSTPTVLFDSSLKYGKHVGQWFERKSSSTVPAVAVLSSEASVRMQLNGADQQVYRQSRRYIQYQPGKSHLVLLTFGDISSKEVNKHIGYFDADNGIFLKSNRNGYYWVKRSNTSGAAADVPIAQSEWNIDKFDGTGPSRYTLDFSKVQIALIDLEWLGVGRVRCGFVVDGTIAYAHEFLQANVGTKVYMKTATLPCRYEMQSCSALSSSVKLDQICASVMSEGGDSEPSGVLRYISTDDSLTSLTSAGAKVILSIRPKLTFKGQTNRVPLTLENIEVFSQDADIHYHLNFGGSVIGGTSAVVWSDVSSSYSAIEYAIHPSGTVAGGINIAGGYIAASEDKKINFAGGARKAIARGVELYLDPDGAHPTSTVDKLTDQVSITAETLGTNSDVGAVFEWIEER